MTGAPAERWESMFGGRPVVIDGGLSTQLERLGADTSGPLWTGRALLADPGAVERAHRAFVDAGAEVIISASYQVSRTGFLGIGLDPAQADEALRASVEVARAAAGAGARVAASVGPYGAILHDGSEYRGDYGLSRAQLAAFHRERIEVLVDAGPDLLAVETIPDLREARVLADVLAEFPAMPAWVSFSCTDARRVCAGQSIEEAVQSVATVPSVMAVGVNCTDPRHLTGLLRRIRSAVDLPVLAYPNSGGSWRSADARWTGAAAGHLPALDWLEEGACAVGGCCGTDDREISRIADLLGRRGS